MSKDNLAKRHNQKIECEVIGCKFYKEGYDETYCTLPSIKVSYVKDDNHKTSTICDSFKTKKDN